MKHLLLAALLASSLAFAGAPKTYQVTGEVVDVTDDLITVKKGKENFEMARTADLKVEGELVKGAKVTVEYRMTAATVTVKGGKKAEKKEEKGEKKEGEKKEEKKEGEKKTEKKEEKK